MILANTLMSIACGAVSAYMARARGKNPFLWFFLGALFGIFGLFFLFFHPKSAKKQASKDSNTIDVTPKYDPKYKEFFWYYLDEKNTQHGPMSFQALLEAYSTKKIFRSSYVWCENLKNWKKFGDL